MKTPIDKLYTWQECAEFDIEKIQELFRQYFSKSQVDLIGSFGFGRAVAVSAEGMYIYTSDGRKILDFTGGIGVLNHGHNHPRILAARIEYQKQKRMEVHKNFLSPYIAGLSHNIGRLLPEDLDISYFCNSGAEAVEGAVKLAYKYHDGNRKHILHADISFHGKLLGAAGLTGSPELAYDFPTIPDIESFEYNNIDSVKDRVSNIRNAKGKSDIYAIILEPFSASSLLECSGEFLKELREICDSEGIILIFDEVYTGWAKTGELFNFMGKGAAPDIVTFSKSFGGGKSSISGYTTRTPFFRKAYDNLSDATLHSTTFSGFGEECITAIEAINIIVEDDYVGRSKRIHRRISDGLKGLREKYPGLINDVRGSGALHGIIFNRDINPFIESLISFIPAKVFKDERFLSKLITGSVISELFSSHNILTFFGDNREISLIISPSLIVTDEEIDRFLDALDKTLAIGKRNLILNFLKQKILKK
ncbi:MAG TPA: aspartate aminotransferase family protein [Nitrospirae bacterium]|nr:putrescine aminotransferase [bacterium BMS3Abin06]HDH11467.1 aspartate aminotransferase family protein [Nitrospirota bacterium]HDZ01379.1 aspartate aminotransferase family protein [Nitrospirota bacterium]